MTPPVVSGAQGDGGRMDDETLAKVERLVAGMAMRLDDQQGWDSARIALNHIRRELGDTRARLAEAQAKVAEFVGAVDGMHPVYGSTSACHGGIGGSTITEHCAHVCLSPKHDKARERYETARTELWHWQRAALGATDQAGDGG